ncbi:MAG: cupredoxin domain-containing protein [Rhodospirillales bacterium]|nr:cupredoxin domain-containing protein [Rhodospirillales bacterium]
MNYSKLICATSALLLLAGTSSAAEITVAQKDKKFTESKITVKVGDQITFLNEDDTTHNLYSKKGASVFDSSVMEPGAKYAIKVDKAGKFTARCAIHPKMKLRVTVE